MQKMYCQTCGEFQKSSSEPCTGCGGSIFLYERIQDEDTSVGYSGSVGTSRQESESSREGGFRVSTVSYKSANFPIVTSNYIPGKDILEVVGIVFSSANRKMGLTTTNVASNAFKDAFKDIEAKARQLGATAVISLAISIERAGPSAIAFSQTVTLLGTAVKIK